jgi:hypothetical protein
MKIGLFAIISALALGTLSLPASGAAPGRTPPCYSNENYATQMALTAMVDAGLIKDPASIYHDKAPYHPYFLKTVLLDSEKVGRYSAAGYPATDVYRQIQKMTVRTRENQAFEVMTISEASFAECSMSAPLVMVLSPEMQVLDKGKFLFPGH